MGLTMKATSTVLDTHLARSAVIRAKLARLQQLTMTASATTQDAVNWSRVGNLGRGEYRV